MSVSIDTAGTDFSDSMFHQMISTLRTFPVVEHFLPRLKFLIVTSNTSRRPTASGFFGVADDFNREVKAVRRFQDEGVHHPNIAEVEFAFQENVGGSIFYLIR
jgi:hypothetical protein